MTASSIAPPASATLRRAGLLRRLAALLYEALLLTAMLFIAGFALAPLVSPGASNLEIPSVAGRTISFVALFAAGAWFYAWIWSEGRRTLPMKTWHIAIVTAAGEPLTRRRALLRYCAAWISPGLALIAYLLLAPLQLGAIAWPVLALDWLAAFVDPEGQFLHDRLAGTRLVMSTD